MAEKIAMLPNPPLPLEVYFVYFILIGIELRIKIDKLTTTSFVITRNHCCLWHSAFNVSYIFPTLHY